MLICSPATFSALNTAEWQEKDVDEIKWKKKVKLPIAKEAIRIKDCRNKVNYD